MHVSQFYSVLAEAQGQLQRNHTEKPPENIDAPGHFRAGATLGAVGIGAPFVLGLRAVEAAFAENTLVGAGFALAASGIVLATLVPSLALATLSIQGANRQGIRGWVAGAIAFTTVAALLQLGDVLP